MNELMKVFNDIFWEPKEYCYHRPIFDSKPYQLIKKDKEIIIAFNALGINADDIKVSVEKEKNVDYLVIDGETKNELTGKTYSANGKFVVDSENIEKIDWSAENGVLIIEVFFKEAKKPEVKINRK